MEIVRPFTVTVNASKTSPKLNVAPFAAVHVAGKSNVVVYVPRPEAFCRAGIAGHGFRPSRSRSTRSLRVCAAAAPNVVVYGFAGCQSSAERCHSTRSEEHTSELQSRQYLVCRLLL